MVRYKEPQVYVINNSIIAEELQDNYTVKQGNLEKKKRVIYEKNVNKRIVNLEYDLADNLHEYQVIIIDLQNKGQEIQCTKDESPNNPPYQWCVDYPKELFDPIPIVMEQLCKRMHQEALRIIFLLLHIAKNMRL